MRFIGIIPARYASTRFPGKPLALVGGKPMIQRVYEQAKKALDIVLVATDDSRIADCVKAFGGNVIMTSSTHTCGTERCNEALSTFLQNESSKMSASDIIVINIQGDEPFINPTQIEAIKKCFPTEIATIVQPFDKSKNINDLENPNTPKVELKDVRDDIAQVITFSRSVVPFLRGVEKSEWLTKHTFYKHVGMYAYRGDILQKIVQLPPTPLEHAESLEQLRWLENGYTIKVAICPPTEALAVDTPEDLEYINSKIKQNE